MKSPKSTPSSPPTVQESVVLDFVEAFWLQHECAPTLREVGDAMGVRRLGEALDVVESLVGKGWLTRELDVEHGVVKDMGSQLTVRLAKRPTPTARIVGHEIEVRVGVFRASMSLSQAKWLRLALGRAVVELDQANRSQRRLAS